MWQLASLLVMLFIGLAVMLFLLIQCVVRSWSRYEYVLIDSIDHRLSGLFMFADSRKIVVLYFTTLIGMPILLVMLGQPVLVVLLVLLSAIFLPLVIFSKLESLRRRRINESLPDTLTQLAASMKAGSTLNSAIESMVAENPSPIGQEFSLLLSEQKLGLKLSDALDNLAERVQTEEMDLVVSAAMISQEVGGNLSEVFQRLSQTIRRKIEMEGKINALTAQGVLQGWIVSLLPFAILLVLVFIEPQAARSMLTSVLGWIFLALIVFLEILGGLMIRKIVNIDI